MRFPLTGPAATPCASELDLQVFADTYGARGAERRRGHFRGAGYVLHYLRQRGAEQTRVVLAIDGESAETIGPP